MLIDVSRRPVRLIFEECPTKRSEGERLGSLRRARKLPLAKVKSTLNSLAEFAHIHMLMKLAGHQWLPSTTYGQQWGDYKEHTRLFTAFAKVGAALAKSSEKTIELESRANRVY